MARRAKLINALTKGVLDPMLRERVDVAHWHAALARGAEIEFLPQGGFTRRAGSMLARNTRMRHRIEPIALASGWMTASNGGNKDNLIDQDPATSFVTDAVGASPFVLVEIDLQVATSVVFVDVLEFSCATARADDALALEYWNGSSWAAAGGAEDASLPPRFNIRQASRTRRFGMPPGGARTARNWRLVVYGGLALGAITIKGLRFWREQAHLTSQYALVPFNYSANDAYQLVFTDRNCDVFDRGTYLASVPLTAAGAELDEMAWHKSDDSLFLFHEDVATPQIMRQGAADEWQRGNPEWTNVPPLSRVTSFAGGEDEIQSLALPGLAAADQVVLFLGDLVTAPITYSGTPGDLPAAIVAALEELPGVDGDGVEASLTATSPITIRITFVGNNGARRWPRVNALGLGASTVEPVTRVLQPGIAEEGLLWSDETGWPRCGRLHQGRMILGGMRAAPKTIAFSFIGAPFDFTLEQVDEPEEEEEEPITSIFPDHAIVYTLESDADEVIHEIAIGKNLQIFTSESEWWSDNRTFDATQPVNFIRATSHGVAPTVPVVFAEEATLFVQAPEEQDALADDGQVLRDFVYHDVNQNYAAEPLSLLNPPLMKDVRDLAARKARSQRAGAQTFAVRDDGGITLLTLNRSQEVIAMGPHQTDGKYLAACVDARNDAWFLVERTSDSGTEIYLERRAPGVLTDGSLQFSGAPTTLVAGLGIHEGKTVWALGDGDILGPHVVSGGQITLEQEASEIVVGLPFLVDVESLPLREKLSEGQPFRPPARIYAAELSLVSTGQVLFGANGGPLIDLALRHLDGSPLPSETTGEEPAEDLLDVVLYDRLFTGSLRLDKLKGFTRHCTWRISQTVPAPLTVRAVRLEIAMRG